MNEVQTAVAEQKPALRGRLHQVAFFLSIPQGVAVIFTAAGVVARVAVSVYAISLASLYGSSALYHRLMWSPRALVRMRRRYDIAHFKDRVERILELMPSAAIGTDLIAGFPGETLRDFDEAYTAPAGGYRSATDYYEQTGARHVLGAITVPTLIITARDDPFIPYWIFDLPSLQKNPHIRLVAPAYGGHCAFIQRRVPDEDRYWAENRLVDFVREAIAVLRPARCCPPT